jgi:hypothetical protein
MEQFLIKALPLSLFLSLSLSLSQEHVSIAFHRNFIIELRAPQVDYDALVASDAEKQMQKNNV